MDCGPATLKSLLEGFGVSVSYGRLREACQTEVDGTSIDTLEAVAAQLGLDSEQITIPVDHILTRRSQALPAIVVTMLPNRFTHFVVVWRRHGRYVQVMDPASGRQWTTTEQFLGDVYRFTSKLPADAWREWASGTECLDAIGDRMAELAIDDSPTHVATALADTGFQSLAALDAAIRMTAALVRSGAIRRGAEAGRLLSDAFEGSRASPLDDSLVVPRHYWTTWPIDGDNAQVEFRGAVLVRMKGRLEAAEGTRAALPPDLASALTEPPPRPGRELLRILGADGLLKPMAILAALGLAAFGGVMEAVLFRGLFEIGHHLNLWHQRFMAIGFLVLFLFGLLLLEVSVAYLAAGMGRRLEVRFRLAFLRKLPLLGDRYFHSRPTSDMAERSHSIHHLRALPQLGQKLLQSAMELLVTCAGLIWLDPGNAVIVLAAGLLCVGLPLLAQLPLREQDMRVRVHGGALARFYLDALLGIVAVRAHGGERAVSYEHESLVVEWSKASGAVQRSRLWIEALQGLVGFGAAIWLLHSFLERSGSAGSALLMVYWVLNLPLLGETVAVTARQYPGFRNLVLRLFEPLGAQEEGDAPVSSEPALQLQHASAPGTAIELQGVTVKAGGQVILEDISLTLEPGEQVAVVGPSGAGKSSLVGLLLGWHQPSAGRLLVDGAPMDGTRLAELRSRTAWVDPGVHLWNRTLLDNLTYGANEGAERSLDRVLRAADLRPVLEKLPQGLQASLGESGGQISGGEGQRVRLGRALARSSARLVILDEPFRGLDRAQRRVLLARARAWWPGATFICITHDVPETRAFPRVVVVEGGRIVEDDSPSALASRDTKYRHMLAAAEAADGGAWSDERWRKFHLRHGILVSGDETPA